MTQAPTPGPLTTESVKLLVKGDLLLCADRIIRSVEQVDVERGVLWFTDGEACGPSVCAFIGRPDADGWMPWSGGENPVPGQMVDVRFRDGTVDENGPSDDWDWPWDADQRQHDIIAFRLAPPAPVEASGSELARWIASAETPFAEGGLGDDLFKRGSAYLADYVLSTDGADHEPNEFERAMLEDAFAGLMQDEALFGPVRTLLSALRPQPSGETRKCIKDALTQSKGWPHDLHPGPAADAILALLSARPLALGGQHSTATDFPPDDVLACDTTPARAEAQDEGAAGEAVAWDYCPECGSREICHEEGDHKQCGHCGQEWFSDIDYSGVVQNNLARLYAHPSPTPAADADRVRDV